jgi:broad specificity phosphatase PhoE
VPQPPPPRPIASPDGESLEDFVARISDVLRFVFAQQRDDVVVVLVGETESNREFLSQLQAAPPVAEAEAMDDIGGGRTRIVRINDTLLVAL